MNYPNSVWRQTITLSGSRRHDTNEYPYYNSTLKNIDASGAGSVQEIFAKSYFDKMPCKHRWWWNHQMALHQPARSRIEQLPGHGPVLDKTGWSYITPGTGCGGEQGFTWSHRLKRPGVRSLSAIRPRRSWLPNSSWTAMNPAPWKHVIHQTAKFVGVWWEMHVGISAGITAADRLGRSRRQSSAWRQYRQCKTLYRLCSQIRIWCGAGGRLEYGLKIGLKNGKEDVFDFVTRIPITI